MKFVYAGERAPSLERFLREPVLASPSRRRVISRMSDDRHAPLRDGGARAAQRRPRPFRHADASSADRSTTPQQAPGHPRLPRSASSGLGSRQALDRLCRPSPSALRKNSPACAGEVRAVRREQTPCARSSPAYGPEVRSLVLAILAGGQVGVSIGRVPSGGRPRGCA